MNKELEGISKLTLLQIDLGDHDPLINNKPALLFLVKYEGPVIDDAYRLVGLGQGHFEIQGNEFTAKLDKSHSVNMHRTFDETNIDKLLKSNPYIAKFSETQPMSEEEIDKLNKREKEMEKLNKLEMEKDKNNSDN
ncbi:hypothetical protein QA612_11230 [Evansella sp. AB-P1]|uniref:hypothetical protein n=1 Tax=Evansella sp. AB-P1 TaxID=3037653 RepID=UPI00241C8B0E|nr:hypothetical protein [Evansella sp. AB-P1]MDG5788063.1 hypothetical protein [Evansella sp. AB-P1]